jgi:endoglucanase
MLFNNILAAAALVSTAFAAPSDKETRANRKLKFFGINESGAEFGEKNFPGVYNKDYTWYDTKTIDQFIGQGMNMFRLNFCMLQSWLQMGFANNDSDGASHSQHPDGQF